MWIENGVSEVSNSQKANRNEISRREGSGTSTIIPAMGKALWFSPVHQAPTSQRGNCTERRAGCVPVKES